MTRKFLDCLLKRGKPSTVIARKMKALSKRIYIAFALEAPDRLNSSWLTKPSLKYPTSPNNN